MKKKNAFIAMANLKSRVRKLIKNMNCLRRLNKKLLTANETIKENNELLERRVSERTQELQLVNEELVTLYGLGKKIVSTLNLSEVLNMIVKTVSAIMAVEAVSVRLLDDRRKVLELTSSCGLSNDYRERCKFLKTKCWAVDLNEQRTPLVIADIANAVNHPFYDDLAREGFRSAVSVPIIFNNETLGIVNILSRKGRIFINSDLKLLQTFASQAAIAIKNAKLHESVHLNYFNTINTLSLAIEARDPYTRGHAERVTNYAMGIGKVLKLSCEELNILKYAGKIHDIGKIAISDLILLKPGKLTPAERAQVELHPIKGVEIVSNLKFLEPGISIIRHHHERYDGAGYPDGLAGNTIPQYARILSVADAYDAMTSERPYRSALTSEDATEELKRNSGKQFDPQMVKAFLQTLSSPLRLRNNSLAF